MWLARSLEEVFVGVACLDSGLGYREGGIGRLVWDYRQFRSLIDPNCDFGKIECRGCLEYEN